MQEAQEKEITKPKAEADYKTLEGIKLHPLYQMLTMRQQAFLLKYLETNDSILAVDASFKYVKKKDVAAMRVLRSSYVRKLVAVFHGYDVDMTPMGRTELANLLAARIRRPSTRDSDFWRMVEVYMELKIRKKLLRHPGRPPKEDPEELTKPGVDIDTLVRQIEEERKVGKKEK